MNICNLENISKSYGDKVLLKDAVLGIDSADKIGVIGVNGTGKSTLLGIAAGVTEADDGQVICGRQVRISYLPQNPVFDEEKTVLENVTDRICGQEEHWDTEGEARAVLARFGISDPGVKPGILSGGQRKRAALAAAILTPCELLILDEPTNHLDSEMCQWLEEYLRGFSGAVLMVTHDRYFLDQVSNCIVEIDGGKLYRYEANYARFLELKTQRMDYALAAERKAAALYKQDLKWMLRGARARSTKQKAHIQRFEALAAREKIQEERQVQLQALPSRLGGKTIEAEGIGKCYDGRWLFRGFTYRFLKTDRIGIIGPNGCGKTTLLRCLTGMLPPDEGTTQIGQTVEVGYFGQENEPLKDTDRVIDFIKDAAEYIRTADGLVSASAMCERFLFDSHMQYQPIGRLSGGEKRRLYLLRILMRNPNVLVLDEPTNDLDIRTMQVLEDYLDHFAGIVITVSHDRYFLDRIVTRIFSFEEGGLLRQSEGAYAEYLEHRQEWEAGETGAPGKTPYSSTDTAGRAGKSGAAGAAEKSGTADTAGGLETTGVAGGTGSSRQSGSGESTGAKSARPARRKKALTYSEQREYDGMEEAIAALEERSAALETEIAQAATDYTRLEELVREKERTEQELEQKLERFVELSEKLEQG